MGTYGGRKKVKIKRLCTFVDLQTYNRKEYPHMSILGNKKWVTERKKVEK